MYRYFSLFKPFGMLSQFTSEGSHKTLADLEFKFPKDVYPIGRLDADSEGLLLLTNDSRVNSKLLDPEQGHQRRYLVQVEGLVTDDAIGKLEKGVTLNDKGKSYRTLPSKVRKVEPDNLPERNPPIRFRKNIPTCWIELEITEGKNRQVRKMTAAAGFPALRLIRTGIEGIRIDEMEGGSVKELSKTDFYSLLKLRL